MGPANHASIQTLEKEVQVARELAILGDYDTALVKLQRIYEIVHAYAKKYEYGAAISKGGYAA